MAAATGVRIRLDLSNLPNVIAKFQWAYLPYHKFSTIKDLSHLSQSGIDGGIDGRLEPSLAEDSSREHVRCHLLSIKVVLLRKTENFAAHREERV